MPLKYNTPRKYQGFREVGKGWWCTAGMGSVTQKWLFVCYARPSEERWRELGIMDYALPMGLMLDSGVLHTLYRT